MTITLNGSPREVGEATTVRQLIAELKLSERSVAVELNRRLLKTERYDTPLREGDVVEIVTFVGGG